MADALPYSAHAAGAPWEGINALDAAVLAYSNISALRQQVHPDSRIHGIIKGSEEWVRPACMDKATGIGYKLDMIRADPFLCG